MKPLLKILFCGLLLFVAAAIVQEWGYFSAAWFGAEETAESVDRESDEAQALGTVREALALMAHSYTSGGDPRFADRMPVAPELLEEMRADIDYLARNRRVQDSRLQKLELLAATPVGADRLELRTREFWIHRTFWSDSGEESEPPRSAILHARYNLIRESNGWRVFGWEFDRSGAE